MGKEKGTTGVSADDLVRDLYGKTADSYAEMMDTEIELPVYSDMLGRLAKRISSVEGPVVDTSCGSGHMLSRYHTRFDPNRTLLGIDLTARMVALTESRLGDKAKIVLGDMRDLAHLTSGSAAAVLSFFGIHHLNPDGVFTAIQEWHRVLGPGGQLVLAAWEGIGPIDYGGMSDIAALRYTKEALSAWSVKAGFTVDRCCVEPVDEMPMDAVYLEGTKV